ncbi:MAG: preprotein translocase subunit SecY [Candidatus Kerfeldbacteria bacterium CG08_land_8_20_14_0_20_40_16]|uniref:Protein translocase subunit SecY n=1 Tax=Candidatus Kerfeldbacteria bacterium CG08_land_8_20_14_0_20_40_16 TaxID=2014244 RepID=A0A2H0YUZ5_9BACT|nr:MAG: preprotein translocase subunit SecY [Candidatus Kerfeldbacteria bacterium CG08_land_8_20_14_0_20_40_16]
MAGKVIEKITQLWKVKDIRNKILYILGLLLVFRIAAHVPVPGVDVENLKNFLGSNQVLGLLNLFSGGALENFSVVMLGLGPYITASIIFQLLAMIIPRLEELQKEGESGRAKINQYTRILTVPLAAMQAYATITLLKRSGQSFAVGAGVPGGVIGDISLFQLASAIIMIAAGSIFLMWLGELISEKGIGNGISLLIFAGIIAGLPRSLQQTFAVFDPSKIFTYLIFIIIAIITIGGVVIITEGQRNIPVSYARRIRGNKVYGGVNTHLPLRVNQAGVIPIIFAISIVLIPSMVARFFANSSTAWIATVSQAVINLFNNQFYYGLIYFIFVVAFTYFYTAVIFHPDQISENLQKQGGFVPGIRPGRPTAAYLNYVSNRILLTGALFLGVIAVLPYIMQAATNIQTLILGGTSLLIVVSVVLETVKQVESKLVMREYEGF